MPRTLHFIKHGKPHLDPEIPAHDWRLADDALVALPALAAALSPRPELVVCSMEPKAQATAQGLAAVLGVPLRPMLGLHEQLRYTAPWRPDPADFQADLRRFFDQPEQVVSGEESAWDARIRFGNAVSAVMQVNPQDTVAVVAHGTVISLLVAHLTGQAPYELWRSLPLLGHLTLTWEPGPPNLRKRL
ncbi:phosphoglycerate mutase family protein [Deinococcus sp. HMF7604]|uniref:histidine phosphatase family protein n=1 Tax=Deinococcus betulae TaxID=2873312 RepID=UPI001CCF231C|nr:histidine phosphatase family protein [Deinococcus betulae]MBZ9751699.1 phosphoglycerate mutase family protein [Deinococcus betulae]